MATITSLAARLLLQDVTFTKTLQKAEKQTEKFAKSVTKVSSGIGNLASITTNINGIASATTGANSAVATLTSSISTSASVMMAATNVAVGLRAAFTAMTAAILMNPLTAALGAVAVAFGVVMALIARSGEQSEEELDRARKAAQEAEELNTRLGGINKRVAQIGMSSDEKEVDDMAKRLRVEVEAGRMRSETAHRWIFLLKHAQAEEKRLAEESQKQIAIQKTIADAVKEREQAGMGAVERQVDNARRSGMDPQQLRFLEITLTATESRNAALETLRRRPIKHG
jgi:hypothetical protein